MINQTYILIIGAIICLLIIYYLYSEIRETKKMFTNTYRKTGELEARVLEIDKDVADIKTRVPKLKPDTSTPVYPLSFKSHDKDGERDTLVNSDIRKTERANILEMLKPDPFTDFFEEQKKSEKSAGKSQSDKKPGSESRRVLTTKAIEDISDIGVKKRKPRAKTLEKPIKNEPKKQTKPKTKKK